MMNLGFSQEIHDILKLLPTKRQTLMFTATFTEDIKDLAREITHNPLEISIDPKQITAKQVEQSIYPVDKSRKSALLIQLYKEMNWGQILVFCKTKNRSDRLVRRFTEQNIAAVSIHGDKKQYQRTKALREFKQGEVPILVATDLAARGIDIEELPMVVNFDLPHLKEDYIHRIGRTGRAESTGLAISLVCLEELDKLRDIERLTKQVLPRVIHPDYQPKEELPVTTLDLRPFPPKKPKKKKKKQIQE
jgi:ATP-dependent RNA helicase RhlE